MGMLSHETVFVIYVEYNAEGHAESQGHLGLITMRRETNTEVTLILYRGIKSTHDTVHRTRPRTPSSTHAICIGTRRLDPTPLNGGGGERTQYHGMSAVILAPPSCGVKENDIDNDGDSDATLLARRLVNIYLD